MQLIEARNRKQKKITLFIHWWMDSHKEYPNLFTMDMASEAEWEAEYLSWEEDVLTDELLEEHMAPPVPTTLMEEL